MVEPISIVEISSSLPGEVPVWVDVSSSLRRAKTKRGKQRQQDKSTAGTATFTFSNADRKFDPENTAGPLFAFLKPMRRIRLRATLNAVTYSIFDGYIDFIEQGYVGPKESTATIAATDGFKRLESAFLPNVWEMTMDAEASSVKAWYRFDEPLNDTLTTEPLSDRSGNGFTASKIGAGIRSVDGLLLDDNRALETPDSGLEGIALPESLTPLALPWAIEFWIKAPRYDLGPAGFNTYAKVIKPFVGPVTTLGQPGMLYAYTRNADDGINVDTIAFLVGETGAPTSFVRAAMPVFDDKPHHVVLVAEAGIPYKTYVDGSLSVLSTIGNSEALPSQGMGLGVTELDITFDEFRVYQGTIPSAGTIAAHNAAGASPWANDLPAARINRVLDLIDWPAADRTLSTKGSPLQATDLGGTALDHLLLIEETELGAIYITADGKVRYYGRDDFITEPFTLSQATFGDAPGENGYTEMDDYRLSDDSVRNIVRRQREGGAEVVARDSTSIATYGPKSNSSSRTQETSDAVAYDRANYLLALTKDALSHVARLEIAPRGNPTVLFPLVLGTLDLHSLITLRRRPQNVGAMIEQLTTIQGVEHELGPKHWRTSFALDRTAANSGLGFFLFDFTLWDDPDWRFSAA